MLLEKCEKEFTVTIKKYGQFDGFSKQIHTSKDNVYNFKGPMGKGLDI